MRTVRAAVMTAPGRPVAVRELPRPSVGPGSALLRVELSEVCGTDIHLREGRLTGVPYPLVPGHVAIGRLIEVHGELWDVDGVRIRAGDRVTFLDVHATCGACWYCLVGAASTRCPERRVYGITYGLEDGLVGGWAEMIHLKPGTRLLRVDDLPARRFMAGGCGLPTALHAVERAEIRLGDTVLVLGTGPVGLSAVILANLAGAFRVLSIGAPAKRLAAARAVGADEVLSIEQADVDARLEWVRDRTGGRGADVTLEATGVPRAVVEAMRFTRDAGRTVIVGQYTDAGDTRFNPHADLNRKHLEVRGVWGFGFSHLYRAVRLLRDPRRSAPWGRLELARYGLEEADRALDEVAAGRVVKALIDPAA